MTQRDNFFWLLAALLLLFFMSALAEQVDSELLLNLNSLLLTATLLVAVWSMQADLHRLYSRWGITVLLVLFAGVDSVVKSRGLQTLHFALVLLFTSTSILIAGRQVLFSGAVDFNKIVGAVCIYMLLAIAWAMVYLLLELLVPGSLPGVFPDGDHATVHTAVYYSFVTITTLGFGDLTPAQPLARYFTYLQAVTGQFYIAILVASLVGVRLGSKD